MRTTSLATAGPPVTNVCLGTSPLGGMPAIYGHDVGAEQAVATVHRFLQSPLTFIDTSNEYGDGESERRIGTALREAGTARDAVVIASKADPARRATTFDGARVLESFNESVGRLGVERLDLFHLHDPERFELAYLVREGVIDAMRRLKDEGHAGLVGVAGGSVDEMHRYLDLGVFDVLLHHNGYTLLDQSAEPLIDHARDAGVAFLNAAPYASGMLAKPAQENPRYQYRAPDPETQSRVAQLHGVCAEHHVPLAALALQFSTRDPRITSTVVGASTPERIDQMVVNEQFEIPDALWAAVEQLLS